MAYGLIKDSTLTAIGNGLRDSGIVRKYKLLPHHEKLKTANATSLDDPTPIGAVTSTSEHITITAHEATSVEVVLDFAFSPEETRYVRLSYKDFTVSWTNMYVYPDTESPVTIRVPPDSYNLEFQYYSGQEVGVTIKAYPLDAEGDYIYVDSDEIQEYTPTEMAEALSSFDMPAVPPAEAFVATGNCTYKYSNNGLNWFIESYGDRMTASGISDLSYTFKDSDKLKSIPFVLNVQNIANLGSAFHSCKALTECPKIRGTNVGSTSLALDGMVSSCYMLQDLNDLFEPEFFDFWEKLKITSQYTAPKPAYFDSCYSLRSVPAWWYKFKLNPESTAIPSSTPSIYRNTFNNCYALDEVKDIPVLACAGTLTTSSFSNTFNNNCRLKSATFETNNGQPIVAKWKSQTLNLATYIGYAGTTTFTGGVLQYNSGITADKEVKDAATYQALKNDPDWYTGNLRYSRYNLISAIETINSLPDTSAYLATAGGTNTIRFKTDSGAYTDGGGITADAMVEAAAIAAAKGWTVSYIAA